MRKKVAILILLVIAAMATSYFVGRMGAAKTPGGAAKTPDVMNAAKEIADAREGRPDALISLTSHLGQMPSTAPSKYDLPKYHKYLKEQNAFINYFAVRSITIIGSNESVTPLKAFIIDVKENRPTKKTTTRKERLFLQFALQGAIHSLGELSKDRSKTSRFMTKLLKNDIPMEWGGGVAHRALSKQGKKGLDILLEQSLHAKDRQLSYVSSAISHIKDKSLLQELHKACLDTKYTGRIRFCALAAVTNVMKESPEAEQIVIDVFMNKKSDLRGAAAGYLSRSGSVRAEKLILEVQGQMKESDNPRLWASLSQALLNIKPQKHIPLTIKNILSSKTSKQKKLDFIRDLCNLQPRVLVPHIEMLKQCLSVENEKGEPLNAGRVDIWLQLYKMTSIKLPLELQFENESKFERVTYSIEKIIAKEIDRKHLFPHNKVRLMAKQETKRFVVQWKNPKKEDLK
jgi:HEAT repeat protein